MSRVLLAGEQKIAIADYMAVYPFGFEESRLRLRPQDARVVVNMVSAQARDRSEWSSRLSEARDANAFAIEDDRGRQVLIMNDFEMKCVSMAASLDVSIVRLVLGGTVSRGAMMEFNPDKATFRKFAYQKVNRQLWGGEISGGGDELLRASLSAPTYVTSEGGCYVREYAALGPANSHGGGEKETASVFQWLVSQGRPMSAPTEGAVPEPTTSEDPIDALVVLDRISGRSNEFGGRDDERIATHEQLEGAQGAVFVVNGYWLLEDTPWRSLMRTVKTVATRGVDGDRSANALLDCFSAASAFDQTALQTKEEAGDTPRGIDTPEYEGILLWGLGDPSGGELSDFMHG